MCSVLCTSNQTFPSHQRYFIYFYTFLSPDNAKVENTPFKPKTRPSLSVSGQNQLLIASQTLNFLGGTPRTGVGGVPPTKSFQRQESLAERQHVPELGVAGVCIGAHVGNVFLIFDLGLGRCHVLGPNFPGSRVLLR